MRTYEEIKQMVSYTLDTEDTELIDKYSYALMDVMRMKGEEIEVPYKRVGDKIYILGS